MFQYEIGNKISHFGLDVPAKFHPFPSIYLCFVSTVAAATLYFVKS